MTIIMHFQLILLILEEKGRGPIMVLNLLCTMQIL